MLIQPHEINSDHTNAFVEVSSSGTNQPGLEVKMDASGNILFKGRPTSSDTEIQLNHSTTIVENNIYMISCYFDFSNVSNAIIAMSINGDPFQSTTGTVSQSTYDAGTAEDAYIGMYVSSAGVDINATKMSVGNIAVWQGTTLTDNQVDNLYNEGICPIL